MNTDHQNEPISKKAIWIGYALSVLPSLLLFFSGAMKLTQSDDVAKEFTRLGYDPKIMLGLGILEIACTILYLIPRTSVLGAILLTGYLGGAMTTHLRIGEPYFMQFLIGVIFWLGLYLRDRRIRALIPLRS